MNLKSYKLTMLFLDEWCVRLWLWHIVFIIAVELHISLLLSTAVLLIVIYHNISITHLYTKRVILMHAPWINFLFENVFVRLKTKSNCLFEIECCTHRNVVSDFLPRNKFKLCSAAPSHIVSHLRQAQVELKEIWISKSRINNFPLVKVTNEHY
jgi:hypothetical protein